MRPKIHHLFLIVVLVVDFLVSSVGFQAVEPAVEAVAQDGRIASHDPRFELREADVGLDVDLRILVEQLFGILLVADGKVDIAFGHQMMSCSSE